MRIVFAGTAEIAVPTLEKIMQSYEIVAVLCAPDKPKGRGKKMEACAVKEAALKHGLTVFDFAKLGKIERNLISNLNPDLLVTFAYGKIFGPRFLSLFPDAALNVHPSLLPLYRGPSPINAAILNGDADSGISVQKIFLDVDSGDILKQKRICNIQHENTVTLSKRIAEQAANLVDEVLGRFSHYAQNAEKQDHKEATYCTVIKKHDGKIDWRKNATSIERMIRAYYQWPGAYTYWKDLILKIHKVELVHERSIQPGKVELHKKCMFVGTGEASLKILQLQLQSKKPMTTNEFLNGNMSIDGCILGENNEMV